MNLKAVLSLYKYWIWYCAHNGSITTVLPYFYFKAKTPARSNSGLKLCFKLLSLTIFNGELEIINLLLLFDKALNKNVLDPDVQWLLHL